MYFFKTKDRKLKEGPVWGLMPAGRERMCRKVVEGQLWWKCYVFMYQNEK
jgi:hypothetical protein